MSPVLSCAARPAVMRSSRGVVGSAGILGGLGNLAGAALGGFALALIEEFGAGYISTAYRDAIGFLVILCVMMLRPQGLFTMKERVG